MRTALLLLLTACSVPPEAPPASVSGSGAPWPRILPVEEVARGPAVRLDGPARRGLLTRASRLRERAAALRGPVIAAGDRARLVRPREE